MIVLDPAIDTWKRTGKQWKAWGSRAVSACLRVGEGVKTKLNVVLCYVPTRAASRQVKDAFFQVLESILAAIPAGEKYVILGDFNARVVSRECVGGQWVLVRGPHGYEVINDAGKELLSFLSVHWATVCNTWFAKKVIHQQTWQHPKSKQWSCIDYVIMSQSDRRTCLDITVKRGAECNTDHQFVCVKIRLAGGWHRRKEVAAVTGAAWPMDGEVDEKWTAVSRALIESAGGQGERPLT